MYIPDLRVFFFFFFHLAILVLSNKLRSIDPSLDSFAMVFSVNFSKTLVGKILNSDNF